MTGPIGMIDPAVTHGVSSMIASIGAQLDASRSATQVVASAIVPPTNDSASVQATMQQQTNVQNFDGSLYLALAEMQKYAQVATSVATAFEVADEAYSGVVAAI